MARTRAGHGALPAAGRALVGSPCGEQSGESRAGCRARRRPHCRPLSRPGACRVVSSSQPAPPPSRPGTLSRRRHRHLPWVSRTCPRDGAASSPTTGSRKGVFHFGVGSGLVAEFTSLLFVVHVICLCIFKGFLLNLILFAIMESVHMILRPVARSAAGIRWLLGVRVGAEAPQPQKAACPSPPVSLLQGREGSP